jgi:hypothetical protein
MINMTPEERKAAFAKSRRAFEEHKRQEEEKDRLFAAQYSHMTFEQLKEERKSLWATSQECQIKAGKIAEIIEERAMKIFMESKHLNVYDWVVNIEPISKAIYLQASESDDRYLSNLIGSDDMYHFSHNMTKTIHLRSDDGELHIYFDNKEEIAPFIKEWGLNVSDDRITEEETKLIKTLESITELRKIFEGKE